MPMLGWRMESITADLRFVFTGQHQKETNSRVAIIGDLC